MYDTITAILADITLAGLLWSHAAATARPFVAAPSRPAVRGIPTCVRPKGMVPSWMV